MRLASNEVVHGRCLEDVHGTCKNHWSTWYVQKALEVCDSAIKVDQNWLVKRIAKSSNL